ncbi:uncharacterized protein LOC134201168, partial [Bombyx mori]
GSIGGPVLWNLLLDPLLKSLDTQKVYCQAFADDVVLVFDGDTALEIENRANAALEHVQEWGINNKLKFAPQKTKAMVITRRLKYDIPRLNMGGTVIPMSEDIKILGVTVDNKLTFNAHVSNVCRRAIEVYKQLARAARASWGLHPEVIKLIYTATIEPIVLYAASVWVSAVAKLGVIKQLAAVQRGIAQKVCKAYRTVSLNSALILAGMLPLDLRVREAASLYEAKKGQLLPGLADAEIEQMTPFAEMPHPVERADLQIVCLEDQEQVDGNSDYDECIFTDGSKIGGKVGAALSIWKGDTETKTRKLALSNYCTVYQAELLALCVATTEVRKSKSKSFGVYSDSMSALQTITNYDSPHPLAVEARQNIKASLLQGKAVTLHWIKAHAGLKGNERADGLAKEAAENSRKRPDYDRCPISFVKRSLRMTTLEEWNRRYTTGETASVTKLFFPDALVAYRIVRKIQPSNILTQIMTGHGGFSEYLCRFKCKESPSCICDPAVKETVPHVLVECPIFAQARHDIEQKLDVKIGLDTLHEIIIDTNRNQFLKYCIAIIGIVIKRNK